MSGHHSFEKLRARMTPERRARNKARTQELLAKISLPEHRQLGDDNTNQYSGSNFDDFLKEEGIFDEVSVLTQQRLEALQAEDMPGATRPLWPYYLGIAAMLFIGVLYYLVDSDIVEPPTLGKDNGQEVQASDKVESGGNEVVPASQEVASGGGENAIIPKDLLIRAEQGDPEAQFLLGEKYYVSKDYVEAYMWWSLAAEQEFDAAQEKRDMVVRRQLITSAQIAEAKRRASVIMEGYKR